MRVLLKVMGEGLNGYLTDMNARDGITFRAAGMLWPPRGIIR
jgi:hypothetical protein